MLIRSANALDPLHHGPTLAAARARWASPCYHRSSFRPQSVHPSRSASRVRGSYCPRDWPSHSRATHCANVLVHECAHIVRLDAWVGLLQRLACVLFWPHPLVHFASSSAYAGSRGSMRQPCAPLWRCSQLRSYPACLDRAVPAFRCNAPGARSTRHWLDAGRPRCRAARHQENPHDTQHVSHEDRRLGLAHRHGVRPPRACGSTARPEPKSAAQGNRTAFPADRDRLERRGDCGR